MNDADVVLCVTVNLDERLRLSSCLDDYKLQEVVVVASGGRNCSSATVLSVNDLPAMKKSGHAASAESQRHNGVAAAAASAASAASAGGKATLRATSSELTLNGGDKKRRGILSLFFGKSKKGSVGGTCGGT